MYIEAYNLLREILEDDKLNDFVFSSTGKRLALIDSGPMVTTPAARISFQGGEITQSGDVMQEAQYTVSFAMPYFDSVAMRACHEFLDVIIEVFFAHTNANNGHRNFIKRLNPTLVEDDPENKWWTISISVIISIF